MKNLASGTLVIILTFSIAACNSRQAENMTNTVAETETGFTGVKPYYQDGKLLKEVTFKNGVRNGLTTTYYPNGMVRQTINYLNEIRTDTAKWYYTTGELYRITPYSNDSINGTQIQYFRGGAIKAKMSYRNSVPKNDLVEYHQSGRVITDYPTISYRISGNPSSDSKMNIYLELSNKSRNVTWYEGRLSDGFFIEGKCRKLPIAGNEGLLQTERSIRKASVIAVYPTAYANARYITIDIDIPN